jgi:hypothetical protein
MAEPSVNELIANMERQRDELDTAIRVLRRQSGLPIEDAPATAGGASSGAAAPGSPARGGGWNVADGEFYGMSGPKAAYALLKKGDRSTPLKTDEIFKLIKKGGCTKVSSPSVLYRNLFRDQKFHKVGRSVWGLTEWYPASVRKAAVTELDEEDTANGLADDGVETDENDDAEEAAAS